MPARADNSLTVPSPARIGCRHARVTSVHLLSVAPVPRRRDVPQRSVWGVALSTAHSNAALMHPWTYWSSARPCACALIIH
eukprot:12711892-Alexandrium_andersonii.AAC.1